MAREFYLQSNLSFYSLILSLTALRPSRPRPGGTSTSWMNTTKYVKRQENLFDYHKTIHDKRSFPVCIPVHVIVIKPSAIYLIGIHTRYGTRNNFRQYHYVLNTEYLCYGFIKKYICLRTKLFIRFPEFN